jgi:hypothetical protein
MKKMNRFFGIALLLISLIGCHFYKQESFILEKINLYSDSLKNEQIGKDLMYYDYAALIKDSLKITDPSYLRNISWQDFVASDSKEVTFRLNLQNEAIEKKKELVDLFDHFVINKLDEYEKKEKQIDTAVQMGYYYVKLMNQSLYDSIWSQHAPLLEKYANKDTFINMLKHRNKLYSLSGIVQMQASIIYNNLDNTPGDFYSVYYNGDNGAKEKVTMENINHTYKLLAYQYAFQK